MKITPRKVRLAIFIVAAGLSFALGFWSRGCGPKPKSAEELRAEREAAALPTGFVIRNLNGVDLSGLDEARRLMALDLLNRVPCLSSAGRISVARCRRDVPSCVTSQRMADFIMDKIRRSMGKEEILVALYDKALHERFVRPELSDITEKLHLEGVPYLGPPEAPVTVALFFDYGGAISRKALESADRLAALYPRKVKTVFCPSPLKRLRDDAPVSARVAVAAGRLGGFKKVNELLYKNEGRAGAGEIAQYAESAGLQNLIQETNSREVVQKVNDLEKEFLVLGSLPPVFFVQGRRITGSVPGLCFLMDEVQLALVRDVRAEYRELEDRIAPQESFGF